MYKPIEYIISSDKELKKLADEWIDRLALYDYVIDTALVNSVDMTGSGDGGEAIFNNNSLLAIINILKPEEFRSSFPFDMEQTLVHELVHLVIDKVANENTPDKDLEQTVELISRALVQAKRDGMKGGATYATEKREESKSNIRKHSRADKKRKAKRSSYSNCPKQSR